MRRQVVRGVRRPQRLMSNTRRRGRSRTASTQHRASSSSTSGRAPPRNARGEPASDAGRREEEEREVAAEAGTCDRRQANVLVVSLDLPKSDPSSCPVPRRQVATTFAAVLVLLVRRPRDMHGQVMKPTVDPVTLQPPLFLLPPLHFTTKTPSMRHPSHRL